MHLHRALNISKAACITQYGEGFTRGYGINSSLINGDDHNRSGITVNVKIYPYGQVAQLV